VAPGISVEAWGCPCRGSAGTLALARLLPDKGFAGTMVIKPRPATRDHFLRAGGALPATLFP
jgi:hypothetical protein